MTLVPFLVGTATVAFGSWWLGWWFPAVWGAVVGVVWPERRPARLAAFSAAAGWAVWLLVPAVGGAPIGVLATRLGGVFQVPGWVLLLVTLLFPALLALCAAVLAARVQDTVRRRVLGARGAASVRHISSS